MKTLASLMVFVAIMGASVTAEEGNCLDHLEDQHPAGTMTEWSNLRSEDDGSGSESGSGDSGRYGNRRKLTACVEYDGSGSASGSDGSGRMLKECVEDDGSGSESGSDDNRHELAEDDDVNAYCRPGANDWPACRSIGYPGCKPGMVRWPQCRNDV